MTIQTKSAIILLATLLLGILIGGLGMNFYKNQTAVRIKDYRERNMFMGLHERIIQPTSDAQRDSIQKVLESYFPKFREFQQEHFQEIKVLLDSLQNDLKPILTDEQWKRLVERRERGERFMNRDGRGKPGEMMPPPFGPPDFDGDKRPPGMEGDKHPPDFDGNNRPPRMPEPPPERE